MEIILEQPTKLHIRTIGTGFANTKRKMCFPASKNDILLQAKLDEFPSDVLFFINCLPQGKYSIADLDYLAAFPTRIGSFGL